MNARRSVIATCSIAVASIGALAVSANAAREPAASPDAARVAADRELSTLPDEARARLAARLLEAGGDPDTLVAVPGVAFARDGSRPLFAFANLSVPAGSPIVSTSFAGADVAFEEGPLAIVTQVAGGPDRFDWISIAGAVAPEVARVDLVLRDGATQAVALTPLLDGYSAMTAFSAERQAFPVLARAYDASGGLIATRMIDSGMP